MDDCVIFRPGWDGVKCGMVLNTGVELTSWKSLKVKVSPMESMRNPRDSVKYELLNHDHAAGFAMPQDDPRIT